MTLEVEGLLESQAFLRDLINGGYVKQPMQRYGLNLKNRTSPYVSSASAYRRTGTLGRSWWTQQKGNDEVIVGNRAPYAGWVQQRSTQAWFHRQHGWATIEDRAESVVVKEQLKRDIHNAVRKLMRKHGGT